MTHYQNLAVSLIAFFLACAATANAGIVFTIQESGADVVASVSGTLDLTGLSSFPGAQSARVQPSIAGLVVGVSASPDNYLASFTGDLPTFGSGGQTLASSSSGNLTGVEYTTFPAAALVLSLPGGYVSNDPLSGSATWLATDLATLGIDPGTYAWTLTANGDSITVNVVPEPKILATVMPLGLACVYVGYRRTRNWRKSSLA